MGLFINKGEFCHFTVTTRVSVVRVGVSDVKTRFFHENIIKLECGPMPNVMVALPNIGGALCSTPQSLADAHY